MKKRGTTLDIAEDTLADILLTLGNEELTGERQQQEISRAMAAVKATEAVVEIYRFKHEVIKSAAEYGYADGNTLESAAMQLLEAGT